MKIYKIAKIWAIIIWITCPFLFGLGIYLLYTELTDKTNFGSDEFYLIIFVALFLIIGSVLGIIELIKSKLIIDDTYIRYESTFINRELKMNEIKGFRYDTKFTIIFPIDETKKRIKINEYTANYSEINEYLEENFINLDSQDINEEQEEIYSNDQFGYGANEIENNLLKANKTAKIINILGGGVGVYTMFIAKPYEISIYSAMLYPVLCFAVLKKFNGLIKFDSPKNSAFPSIALGIILPFFALMLRSILDFELLDYYQIIYIASGLMLISTIILTLSCSNYTSAKISNFNRIIAYVILSFMYFYSTIVLLNCTLDTSITKTYEAKIIEKTKSEGKTTSYYLRITPWGNQKNSEEYSVSSNFYVTHQIGDEIHVFSRKGFFRIPWIEINE